MKFEFSKLLAVMTTAFFFGVIVFSLVVWLLQNRIPTEILTAVAVPFGTVTTFYYVKAGYENGKKIDGSNEQEGC